MPVYKDQTDIPRSGQFILVYSTVYGIPQRRYRNIWSDTYKWIDGEIWKYNSLGYYDDNADVRWLGMDEDGEYAEGYDEFDYEWYQPEGYISMASLQRLINDREGVVIIPE